MFAHQNTCKYYKITKIAKTIAKTRSLRLLRLISDLLILDDLVSGDFSDLSSLSDLVMFTGVLHTPDVGEGMTCTS